MRYQHVDGVDVTAEFSWESDLRYRYRLKIILRGYDGFIQPYSQP